MFPNLKQIAAALNGEISGDQVRAPGPGHSPNDRSMLVKVDQKAPDGFVVHSHAGDDDMACKSYVRERLGLPVWKPTPRDPIEKQYIYRLEDGSQYLRVSRTRLKKFWQHRWTGSEWVKGRPNGPKIPYRLPELIAATEKPTFVCEGEKDADRLAVLGLVATSASEGAGKWTADLNRWFKDRTVYVLADNDEPGAAHALKVANNLNGVAAKVSIVDLPGLPPKGDVSDWLDAGGAAERLVELCQSFPVFERSEDGLDREQIEPDAADFRRDKNGAIIPNDQNNMRVALARLGAELKHDTFANRSLLAGAHLDDAAVDDVWFRIDEDFHFRPTHDLFHRFVENEARRRAFHPVRDYLDALLWDGVARIDRWLVEYAGAQDSAYTRAVGRLMLVAAVRRIRDPGCKFDEMLVFISEQQGLDKSTALATLAVRPEWFTDSISLKARDKEAIEQLAGKWIVEVPELKGMRNSDIEHVKAFLSRQVDRGRLAYGRLVTEAPRQCVLFGTSNETKFLKDTSGNRRFWPIKGARFDVEKLRRDRDKLWAEAAAAEAAGEGIRLDPKLYSDVAAVQDDHREEDPWVDVLRDQLGNRTGKIRSLDVWKLLGIKPGQQNQTQNTRMGQAMRELGWQPAQRRFDRVRESAYVRGTSDEQETVLVAYYDKVMSEMQVEQFKKAEIKRLEGLGL